MFSRWPMRHQPVRSRNSDLGDERVRCEASCVCVACEPSKGAGTSNTVQPCRADIDGGVFEKQIIATTDFRRPHCTEY